MNHATHNAIVSFIWGIADDVLRWNAFLERQGMHCREAALRDFIVLRERVEGYVKRTTPATGPAWPSTWSSSSTACPLPPSSSRTV